MESRSDEARAAWRLLRSGPADGAANMALDLALLRVMERRLAEEEEALAPEDGAAGGRPDVRPVLRLYAWSPPAVSTGRHQALGEACDLDACMEAGVDVVQRPTGGRGVLHEHEVTFSVVAPAAGPFEGAGVARASALIARALVRGLRHLGADVVSARGAPPMRPGRRRGACFAATSREEIVADGRKLCGSAQFRGRRAFLQHGSLPLVFDLERQARLLGVEPAALADKALGLADCLGRVPEAPEVEEALASGFAEELAVQALESPADVDELAEAAALGAALRADAERFRSARETPCSA